MSKSTPPSTLVRHLTTQRKDMSLLEKQAWPVVASCNALRMCPLRKGRGFSIFFYGLADYNQQNIHLHAMVDRKDIKRVGTQGQHGLADGVKRQKRKYSYVYWVHTRDHKRIKVRQEII